MEGKSLTPLDKFNWTDKKRQAAEELSTGTLTIEEVGEVCKVSRQTIHEWKHHPEFIERIDQLTLSAERHQVAGMLREIDKKMDGVGVGKTDWAKLQEMKIKLLGLEKHKVEHSGGIGVCIVDDVPKE